MARWERRGTKDNGYLHLGQVIQIEYEGCWRTFEVTRVSSGHEPSQESDIDQAFSSLSITGSAPGLWTANWDMQVVVWEAQNCRGSGSGISLEWHSIQDTWKQNAPLTQPHVGHIMCKYGPCMVYPLPIHSQYVVGVRILQTDRVISEASAVEVQLHMKLRWVKPSPKGV